jgi:hypothetical protein
MEALIPPLPPSPSLSSHPVESPHRRLGSPHTTLNDRVGGGEEADLLLYSSIVLGPGLGRI